MSYYQHIDDFDGVVPIDNAMPSDVKRLLSHCNHNYHKRYYFFSPSQRKFYRYYEDGYAYTVYNMPFNKGLKFTFIPDENDKLRDSIYLSNRFMQRIEHMNKLILPKLQAK